jgi:ATP-dependent RNA helicase DeaD
VSDDVEPNFSNLGLAPGLLHAVESQGYERPTPIQAGAIPALLAGRDVVGQAQTGTGKTAAFALPLLQSLDLAKRRVQAIVLTPTRELALQVAKSVSDYGRHLGGRGATVLPVYGGQPMHIQSGALKRGVHVVIGTPGRVKDLLDRGILSLQDAHFFGLDEADEMLNMGFIEDVEWILDQAPPERQVALFSATFPGRIRGIAEKYLKDPVDVKIADHKLTVPNIEQRVLRAHNSEKSEILDRILEAEDHEAVLVFVRTQLSVEAVTEYLVSCGHQAECVHGGINQSQRETVVKRLRQRRTKVVVATDVAARGLDVDHITLVVNYDLPREAEAYVHRIGRTGRAGRAGRAISFWSPRDRRVLQAIERHCRIRLEPMKAPGLKEILERRRGRLAAKIKSLTEEDLSGFEEYTAKLAEEDGLDMVQIAAALARLAWGDGLLTAPKAKQRPERGPKRYERAPQRNERSPQRNERGPQRNERGPKSDERVPQRAVRRSQPAGAPRPERTSSERHSTGHAVEIVLPAGKRDRLRPEDVVGAIAGESGLPGSVVGSIRILERITFVSLPEAHVDRVIDALSGVKLRGRSLRPRRAHPQVAASARRGR